jgi:hypothetical protein
MNDDELDRALRALPRADLDPLTARAQQLAAERALRAPKLDARAAAVLRYESIALAVLSALQLAWAAARVLTLVK